MPGAFFGPPRDHPAAGGTHVTVHVVPVFEGRLVAFDIRNDAARGRWLPWDVLPFQGNPWQFAAELVDEWCDGAVSDLSLADVMSLPAPAGGWEIALVFRAELTALPAPEPDRTPFHAPPGRFDAIGAFDPVDLERWVARGASPASPGRSTGLVF